MKIDRKSVLEARSDDLWSVGNQVLYDLCSRYPRHDRDDEVVAKVWLIGRAYSASIERGRGQAADAGLSNDRFYTEAVPQVLRASGLDGRLEELGGLQQIDESNVRLVLSTHGHLVRAFHRLTKKNKRSLASKYLHFHRPSLFFIYDSRAASAIRRIGPPREPIKAPRDADPGYTQFVSAAMGLRAVVQSRFGLSLSPRQLDRLLLAAHEHDV